MPVNRCQMKRVEILTQGEDQWITDLGAFFPGKRVVYRGKDLFRDLKDTSWMALLMYGITNREFTDNQLTLFERIWNLSISYPDPRIWNNRVAALAGTSRSTGNLGVSAAIAVTEATIYGQRASLGAIDFLIRTKKASDMGVELLDCVKNELKKYRGIFGYGRPLTNQDERIEPVYAMAKDLELHDGPHTQLAFEVEEILLKGRWRMRMNVGGLIAALCADQGLSRREQYYYLISAYLAGIIPCYVDSVKHQEGTFFPFRCSRIKYIGPKRRSW